MPQPKFAPQIPVSATYKLFKKCFTTVKSKVSFFIYKVSRLSFYVLLHKIYAP